MEEVVHAHLKSGAVEFARDGLAASDSGSEAGEYSGDVCQWRYVWELRAIFDKLSVGADKEFLVDLRDMPFGSYGRLTDRYGVEWFPGRETE